MAKALVAVGASTVNVLTKFRQIEELAVQIVWIGSHQQDFVSLKVRDYIGDIVHETKDHVVGTRGELLYITSGQTFEGNSVGATADQQRIAQALAKYDDVYIVSSLGGGTTSCVTPFIAELCAQHDPLMQAVVTLPAKLEPRTRHEKAQRSFHSLQQTCPIIHLVTNNGENEESLVSTFVRRDELLASLLHRLLR